MNDPFIELIGQQLASVTFVQDYVQLHFDGPLLTLYVWPSVRNANTKFIFGEAHFRDRLCEQIAKKVKMTRFIEGHVLEITFSDNSQICVSLDDTNPEITGPEILNYINSNKEWTVI